MSSITIIPRSYASTTSSNLPNINIPPMRPAYLNPKPAPRTIPPTYQHLTQQVQRKPALYGAGQRKYNNFHKFQTGTTTTFNGYTNYNGSNNINLPPTPAPRQYLPPTPFYNNNNRYQQQQNYHYNRYNNYRRPNFYNNNNYNNNIKNLPSLLDINPFHLPSEHNTRSFHHAQQYHPNQQHHQHLPRPTSRTRFHILSQLPSQSRSRSRSPFRPPPIKPRRIYQQQQQNNNNKNNYRRPPVPVPNINNNNNNFKGIILSDSMCSRVRTYALKNNYINIELSYESGCDIVKMINWLNTPEGRGTVGDKQFLLFCLGTNDVGRYGVDVSLQRVSELIRFVRQSFPGIRTIGWLSLSPRWKPTRFVSAAQIGQMHNQFNEHLRFLSKKLDFDIVDARLGPLDMRVEDGLHPSTTTGRWKYEGAIREWFSNRAAAHFSSSLSFQHHHQQQRPTVPTPTILTSTPIPTYASVVRRNNNDNQQHYQRSMKRLKDTSNFLLDDKVFNSTQPFSVTTDSIVQQKHQNSQQQPNLPSRTLINFYPNKLRSKDQFFRDNQPPPQLEKEKKENSGGEKDIAEKKEGGERHSQNSENKKQKLFLIANSYYQMRHFEEESKKWKIYEKVASRKEEDSDKDGDDVVMKEIEEIPQPRPRRERFYSRILDMTITDDDSQTSESSHTDNKGEASESSSETEEEGKKKRKLRDTSLSPTSKEKAATEKDNSIRKKKPKSKKKKKISIENDPRAPEGSPVLLVNENSSKEAGNRTPKNVSIVKEIEIIELPKTPPGLVGPPIVSPRQSTPRTPVARPQPLDIEIEIQKEQQQEEIVESVEMIEQDKVVHSPSVISKEIDIDRLNIVNFPITPIECKFHFKIFHQPASVVNIIAHREFLEKKAKQQEKELEQHMEYFSEEVRKIVVEYIKNSVDPLVDILKISNQKRLDNLVLDQIREKALRIIRSKGDKNSLELVDKAQMTLERTLELKFQLDKLDRRLNENMPPPALNVMDKLHFRSKVLSNENREQYSEQWNNVIRKSKLDLTSIMRLAK
ncbi:unnamed protein product, partial [Rotaria socialis]